MLDVGWIVDVDLIWSRECKNWEMKRGIGSVRLANISLSSSKSVAKYFKDNFYVLSSASLSSVQLPPAFVSHLHISTLKCEHIIALISKLNDHCSAWWLNQFYSLPDD